MACLFTSFATIDQPAGSGAAKTLLRIQAPSTHGVRIRRGSICISTNAGAPGDAKHRARLTLGTGMAGTAGGTIGTSRIASSRGNSNTSALVLTENYSAEPTGGVVICNEAFHPTSKWTNPGDIELAPGEQLDVAIIAGASLTDSVKVSCTDIEE